MDYNDKLTSYDTLHSNVRNNGSYSLFTLFTNNDTVCINSKGAW